MPSLNCPTEIGSIKQLWAAASALSITANFDPIIIIIIRPIFPVNKIGGFFWVFCWSRVGVNHCPEWHRGARRCHAPLPPGTAIHQGDDGWLQLPQQAEMLLFELGVCRLMPQSLGQQHGSVTGAGSSRTMAEQQKQPDLFSPPA